MAKKHDVAHGAVRKPYERLAYVLYELLKSKGLRDETDACLDYVMADARENLGAQDRAISEIKSGSLAHLLGGNELERLHARLGTDGKSPSGTIHASPAPEPVNVRPERSFMDGMPPLMSTPTPAEVEQQGVDVRRGHEFEDRCKELLRDALPEIKNCTPQWTAPLAYEKSADGKDHLLFLLNLKYKSGQRGRHILCWVNEVEVKKAAWKFASVDGIAKGGYTFSAWVRCSENPTLVRIFDTGSADTHYFYCNNVGMQRVQKDEYEDLLNSIFKK